MTTNRTAFGIQESTVYDIEDRPVYVTDANSVTITNTYDALGRLRTRGYPDGGVERFGYSARGLVAYTNQLQLTNFLVYDPAGRKTFETNANGQLLRFTYNPAGDLMTLTDGKNQVTSWNYDENGRVTSKLDQAGVEMLRYQYDANGRLTNRWSKQKLNTVYSYDPVGNLTNVNYPSSVDVVFQYDWLDRVTNMVDASGTTKYSYTAAGQLLTEDGPFSNDTVTNMFINRLRTGLSLQQPTGAWTNGFGYDVARRLTNVTSQAGSFVYQLAIGAPSLLPIKLMLPNTAYITNVYDSVARLTGTYLKNSTHSFLNFHEYTSDPANQRTQQVFNAGSTYNYTYDKIGQLKVADSATAAEDRRYGYDDAWNLNYRTNDVTYYIFAVDGLNQLTNLTGDGALLWDANGNLTNRESGDKTFEYDDENRLIRWINAPGGSSFSLLEEDSEGARTDFTYDGLGRLRKREERVWDPVGEKWEVATSTIYVYDGRRVIQERDEFGSPTVSYTRGTDLSGTLEGAGGIGGLLARSHGYSAGNWSTHNFYHADGNGNITYLINSSQTLAASYRYDPFGNTVGQTGTLADANSYRFSSKEIHFNSGMYYFLYRFHDPNLQRWISRDPLATRGGTKRFSRGGEADLNAYAFAGNDPINFVDPNGLWAYYGNWGGPNWTGGYKGTWEDVVDNGITPLPPTDNQDACYEQHDKCHANCRDDFRQCKAEGKWRSGKLKLGGCLRKCDRDLARCLRNLGQDPSNNCHARTAACVFRFLGNFGHTIPSDVPPRHAH